MMKTFVLSLGGSLVCPEPGKIDTAFLRKFRALILKYVKKGNRFAIIVGGGKLCRVWQDAAAVLGVTDDTELNWIGIRTTQANAEVVRAMFGSVAVSRVVYNPKEKVSQFKIVIGAGHRPGASTDYGATVRAKTIGAKTVINLSNVDYVYDKDPRKFSDAKPLKNLSWDDYFSIIGTEFKPGMNSPFDPKASAIAARAKMQVVFLGGRDLGNLEKFLQGKKFNGTIIG